MQDSSEYAGGILRKIVVQRVTVVKFRVEIEAAMVGLLVNIKARTDTA